MLFVTGTDTGVGKTFFSVSLIRALRELGVDAVGFKPVETGCQPSCQDAELLAEACGLYLEPVYSFKTPVAPSVAAELEGVRISPEQIEKRILELSRLHPFLVIEGAGGIMVPITWSYLYLDLVRELSLPVVVVALNRLGVINHTLLTVRACLEEGVEVRAVVLNSFKKERDDRSFETNLNSLKKLLDVPVFPFFSPSDALHVADTLLS